MGMQINANIRWWFRRLPNSLQHAMVTREVGTVILPRLAGTCSDPKRMLAMSSSRRRSSLWVRWSVRRPSPADRATRTSARTPTGLYRYFIWYDIADRTAAYLSKAMKSCAIGIPERPLLALVQIATQVCRGHRSRFKASEADDSMPQRDRSLALSFSSRFGFRLIKFDTTALGQHDPVQQFHECIDSFDR